MHTALVQSVLMNIHVVLEYTFSELQCDAFQL